MDLFYKRIGAGPALFILHGLYGSSDNWYSFAKNLSDKYTVYLVDLRNHGRSPHHNEHSYEVMCDDVKQIFIRENLNRAVLLGHSMGGKVAMLFSLMNPEYISGLIVADIAPVNYSSVDKFNSQVIIHLNIIHTLLSIDFSTMKDRSAIDNALSVSIKDADVRQFLMKSVHRNQDGSFNWKFNLQAISNALPKIMGFVIPEKKLAEGTLNQIPVLFIKGGRSDYIIPGYYPEIKRIFPNAVIETIPNAGHWLHAEQPSKFLNLVTEFLGNVTFND